MCARPLNVVGCRMEKNATKHARMKKKMPPNAKIRLNSGGVLYKAAHQTKHATQSSRLHNARRLNFFLLKRKKITRRMGATEKHQRSNEYTELIRNVQAYLKCSSSYTLSVNHRNISTKRAHTPAVCVPGFHIIRRLRPRMPPRFVRVLFSITRTRVFSLTNLTGQ